ncbi:alpha-galactosidase [Actinoallomurus acaciae]|uniref:Alpha-galactosidase n=1 Tax=Actinoallomurus acaciae TaxID=502577 RepID=A0ABV5YKJ5_9ACTN
MTALRPTGTGFDADTATWILHTPNTTYALRLTDGRLAHVHWGAALTDAEAAALPVRAESGARQRGSTSFEARYDGTEEYAWDGGVRYGVPSLQVRFADGARGLDLEPVGDEAADDGLTIRLRDRHYPLEVALRYRLRPGTDVIERSASLTNLGDAEPIEVLRFDAASWVLPHRDDYRLSHVTGMWGAETRLRREVAAAGETVFTSRRGITSHHANPWVMTDDGTAGESHGEVWSVALAWSGSWRMTVQRTPLRRLSVSTGFGHDGISWRLAPGERLETPVSAGMFTTGGFGAASRAWHAHVRRHVLPRPEETRPVLYNSWEATFFDIDVARQSALATRAAELGAELFVVDDGWFRPYRDDRAGLGDWRVNAELFPDGFAPLAEHVRSLGMGFGIWVEPEMVNPDSDLYRAHPDRVLHQPHRARTELRNQLVLNFGRDDVRAWAGEWLHRLVRDTGAVFLKWDMNRTFSEAGEPGAADPDRLWIEHTRGVHLVMDRLRDAWPDLRIESCSGGGGRLDLAMLARTDQVWASDNTDAADRLRIQHGFTQLYPPGVLEAWVTDSPNTVTGRRTPLAFRFHVAMTGVLGLGGDLAAWSDDERREAASLVALYKRIRPLVQHGRLYRLRPPDAEGLCALQFADRDVVVFAFRETPRMGFGVPPLPLAGLPRTARYRDTSTGAEYDAGVLTHHGLPLDLPRGEYASTVVHLERRR